MWKYVIPVCPSCHRKRILSAYFYLIQQSHCLHSIITKKKKERKVSEHTMRNHLKIKLESSCPRGKSSLLRHHVHCSTINTYSMKTHVVMIHVVCSNMQGKEDVHFNTYTARPVCWNGWISDSYCSLKPLCSGMGEVVPARTLPILLPHPLALCCHYPVSKCCSASIVATSTVRVKVWASV